MGFEIAVYGKGGIGKSTVSSNLSYTFAKMGRKTVQIGCDPKHDSTRQLLKGKTQTTVLEHIRGMKAKDRKLEDLAVVGSEGVICIEAGGPEPGVGCAGKGILTMFQTLERLGLGQLQSDVILYDVLGDVVCGGFAVPMRPDCSDCVVIVSSGEFMSIYAANNIMKGLLNFEEGGPRLAGIVFNSRGSPCEELLIREFSRATATPILGTIARSERFAEAERSKVTLCELYPDSEESSVFRSLAEKLSDIGEGTGKMVTPSPLTDVQLDELVATGTVEGHGGYVKSESSGSNRPSYPKCSIFTPVKRIGMGPIGAAITAGKLTDVPVVIHGSRSCGYSMLNEIYDERLAAIRAFPERFTGTGDNMFCSEVGTDESIFGGASELETLLEKLAPENRFIIVIMTCLTNMIGDDVESVVRKVESRHPGIRIRVINANEAVEGVDAHMEVLKAIVEMIDTTLSSDGRTVRIADDSFIAVNRGTNEEILGQLMMPFGKTVGRGFLNDCTLQNVREIKRTELVFLAEDTSDNRTLGKLLASKGVKVAMHVLPKGFREGREWIQHLGEMFDNRAAADYLVRRLDSEYNTLLGQVRGRFEGKRIAIIDDSSESVGWMEEALRDAGTSEIIVYSMGAEAREQYIAEVRWHPNRSETVADILADSPDLVIGSKRSLRGLDALVCSVFPATTLGGPASLMFLEHIYHILGSRREESWQKWRDTA